MHDRALFEKLQTAREFNLGVELAAAAIPWPGRPRETLEPDATKAYCEFDICYAWPVRTAYGAAFHPGTLLNSHKTMLHQVFNRGHQMKSYLAPEEQKDKRDYIFGGIVGVEMTAAPMGGFKINSPAHLHVAAVIYKNAEGVPKVLGEHLGGRHKWAVSQEVNYSLLDSGFVIEPNAAASVPPEAAALMKQFTTDEFRAAGLAYVPVLTGPESLCPEDLLDCYSFTERRVVKDWCGQRVTVLKGGINGRVHFQGVGMVRYGAEKEAQIQQILASDPDRVEELAAEGDVTVLGDVLKIISENSKNVLTSVASAVQPRS